jgi:MFS family permease
VAGFGVATIVFGFSRSFWLSFAMLFLTGLLDMVSVVVRHTLVQLCTPDEMRGRVQAINGVFIGASNELGGFESGAVAHLFSRADDPAFGPTVSVVSGGVGTLIIVALTAWLSPALRRYDVLHEPEEES